MWCLYFQPGRPMPVGWTPEQHGWIRVICDKDATVGLIAGLQGRLKAWGVYAGPVSGRYDAATARAVVRFQTERRIPHGGYLSLATVQALRDEPGPPSPPAPAASIYPSSAHGATFPGQWSPPEPPQAPCGQAPCSPAPCPGSSPCAVILAPRAAFAPYRPLLSWPGKSIY
jgi:peptidoglycan hydrolase-like protein with peptidoglycan-binding domain